MNKGDQLLYTSVELFAGAGGMALGFEAAGFYHNALAEWDKHACATLRLNRPDWNIIEGDVSFIDWLPYKGADIVSGGFPCQAFSYAGKGGGFEDTRGTLFFEWARAVNEIQPKIAIGENVKGLVNHDSGKTLKIIRESISELGYHLIEPRVLNAADYWVPQKRERLFLVALRDDLKEYLPYWKWPQPSSRRLLMRDALKAGELYPCDVPLSAGQEYSLYKKTILTQVPAGGCWRDLPDEVARDYMKGSYFLSGGRTGMARRLSWDEPCLTLTCSPSQNQTERCHPEETRPLRVREYARIQTFPDEWTFAGSLSAQYRQIGNAVPVNLAQALATSVYALLDQDFRANSSTRPIRADASALGE